VYSSPSLGAAEMNKTNISAEVFPNPANNYLNVFIQPIASSNFVVTLTDDAGRTVFTQSNIQPTILYSLNVSQVPAGMYVMTIKNEMATYTQKVVIEK
jgi:hypothetical protein